MYGNTYPLTVWRTFMEEIHAGLENKPFPEYHSSSKPNNSDNDDYNHYAPEPTLDPDAIDPTEEPKATKKPKVTEEPVETPEPTQEPVAEPTEAPDDNPVDVPDDNLDDVNQVDDVPDTQEE